VVTLYNWDLHAATAGETWFDEAASIDAQIKQHAPHLQKIAVILPYWQVYWPDTATASAKAIANTPMDLRTWQRQVDWLVSQGWDIVLWLGYSKLADVKAHAEYLAKFR